VQVIPKSITSQFDKIGKIYNVNSLHIRKTGKVSWAVVADATKWSLGFAS